MDQKLNGKNESAKPKLLERVRLAVRSKYYSIRTEQAYVDWVRRFILFHGKRHPENMGEEEIRVFLSHLATERDVAAATQNQALSALLFLYREVLGVKLSWVEGIERTTKPRKLPVVLSRDEVRATLEHVAEPYRLMAELLYGS